MASVTFTIPDAAVPRYIHALSIAGGFRTESVANAKETVARFMRQTVRNIEYSESQSAALAAVAEPQEIGIT